MAAGSDVSTWKPFSLLCRVLISRNLDVMGGKGKIVNISGFDTVHSYYIFGVFWRTLEFFLIRRWQFTEVEGRMSLGMPDVLFVVSHERSWIA